MDAKQIRDIREAEDDCKVADDNIIFAKKASEHLANKLHSLREDCDHINADGSSAVTHEILYGICSICGKTDY